MKLPRVVLSQRRKDAKRIRVCHEGKCDFPVLLGPHDVECVGDHRAYALVLSARRAVLGAGFRPGHVKFPCGVALPIDDSSGLDPDYLALALSEGAEAGVTKETDGVDGKL